MTFRDVFVKKQIPFHFRNTDFSFHVSQELFSSQQVDHGTQRLLRSLLFAKVDNYTKVLDLGCGYGPLGIVLQKLRPESRVTCADRDALALEFTQWNAAENAVQIQTTASLGYDSVPDTDFDLIVSNIPAKVGESVLKHMLLDARAHLAPDGLVAIVVVDPIAEFVEQVLITNETVEITYHRHWPGHHVYHYRFVGAVGQPQESAFVRGVFYRDRSFLCFPRKEVWFGCQLRSA
ncbi:class I SAM-dependent methyltransferase [Candidatus Woesebacteria bacterium]|nr:class I SAM-dependent methyltransferase [Candidatus Woesebacteria bacterium]